MFGLHVYNKEAETPELALRPLRVPRVLWLTIWANGQITTYIMSQDIAAYDAYFC